MKRKLGYNLLIGLLLSASVEAKQLVLVWECEGKVDYMDVDIVFSDNPAATCVELAGKYLGTPEAVFFALQIPLSCSFVQKDIHKAKIVIPYNASSWMIRHELGHVMGAMNHPPLLPIFENWRC